MPPLTVCDQADALPTELSRLGITQHQTLDPSPVLYTYCGDSMNQNCREPGSATIQTNFSSKLYWWQLLWYVTIFSPEHKQTSFLYPLYNTVLIHQSLTSAIIYIVVSVVPQMSSADESDSLSRQIQRHLSSASSEMFNRNSIFVSTAKLLQRCWSV